MPLPGSSLPPYCAGRSTGRRHISSQVPSGRFRSSDTCGGCRSDGCRWVHWSGARSSSPVSMHCTARGIPIYVADAGASVVRDILAAPHRQAPDSLSRLRLTPTVRVVSRMLTIGTGDERLELRAARGRHASMMMLVWLPARRLLYASDVVIPDAFEPVFAAAYRGSSCGWCSARGSMWSGCSASTCQRRHGPSSCVSREAAA